jgi:AsmA protein
MKSTLKILAWLFGLIVVLVILAAIILPRFFDPNDFRGQIADAVREQTGRELIIEGDLKLTVIPWLGVSIGRTSLSNDPAYGDTPMVAIEDASVGVRLMPLLSRRIEVSEVRLEGLRLNLVRDAAGTNWDSLVASSEQAPVSEPEPEAGSNFDLKQVGGIRVRDAQVSFQDKVDKISLKAQLGQFNTGAIAVEGQALDLDGIAVEAADLNYDSKETGVVQLSVGKIGTGRISGPAEALTIDGAEIDRAEMSMRGGPDGDYSLRLASLSSGKIVTDPEAPQIGGLRLKDAEFSLVPRDGDPIQGAIPSFEIDQLVPGQESPLKGRLTARVGEPATEVDLDLNARARMDGPKLSLAALVARLKLTSADLPGGSQTGELAADAIHVDQKAQTLSLEGARATLAGLNISLQAKGTKIIDAPELTGRLDIAEFSPRALLKALALETPVTADPDVLTRAAMSGDFASAGKKFSLTNLKARLDDSALTGQLSVIEGTPQIARASLQIDAIDLDRYLPPAAEEGEAPAAETADAEINSADLRGKDVEASLDIGQVKVSGLTLSGVKAKAVIRDGKLIVDPLQSQLYDGSVQGRLALDGSGDIPVLTLRQTLQGVQVSPLLNDLAEVKRLAGVANFSLDLNAAGRTSTQMTSALNGKLNFGVDDGRIRGINITHSVRYALALLERQTPPVKTTDDTPFDFMRGTATIVNGVMYNEDLTGDLIAMNLTGKGKINLVDETIDYDLEVMVPEGQRTEELGLGRAAGRYVPIKVSGSLDDPSVKADVGALIGDKVKSLIRDQLGIGREPAPAPDQAAPAEGETPPAEEPKSTQDQLKEEAAKKLKKLFGG